MPLGRTRTKVLLGIGRGRGKAHRYTVWRWAVAVGFTAGVACLPLLGILRFDFWGGRHLVLGRELGFVEVCKAFAFPFLAINVVILLVTRFAGRYLCGFVCPYGAVARIAEWLSARARTARSRAGAAAILVGISLLLAGIVFVFVVDPRVLVEGSATARALALAFLLGTASTLYLVTRRLGLRFCRDWCPSGVYFAVLGRESWTGVEFAHPDSCTDCGACKDVCPVDLEPRDLVVPDHRPGTGLYPDGLSSLAACVRCGDCIIACEGVNDRRETPTPLRLGPLSPGRREPEA